MGLHDVVLVELSGGGGEIGSKSYLDRINMNYNPIIIGAIIIVETSGGNEN